MSLQIWLPLNGSLENQGINSSAFTSSATYDNNGKIGKCLSSNINLSVQGNLISKITLKNQYSFALWMKSKNSSGWAFRFGDINSNTTSNSRGMWINIGSNYEFAYQDSGTVIDLASTICDNNWHHIVYAVNDKSAIIYVDGKLVKNLTLLYNQQLNYEYIQLNGNISYINDFRIYDHCLSAKEVKELAKGLVLHYRLAGPGQANLTKGNNTYERNSASTDGNFWFSGSNFNCKPSTTYTLSIDIDGTISNFHGGSASTDPTKRWASMWFYLCKTGTSTNAEGSYDSPILLISTNYNFRKIGPTRYAWTYTTPADARSLSIRGNTYSNGKDAIKVKFWNPKIEEGSIATPWCPRSDESIYTTLGYNNNIEYDCSGYCRNGTKSGTITWDIDSPRYTTSYKWPAATSAANRIISPNCTFDGKGITMAVWVKFTGTTAGGGNYHMPLESSSPGYYEMSVDTSGRLRAGIYVNGTRYVENCANPSMYDNKWHHIAITYNGSKICRYVDGKAYVETNVTGTANGLNQAFYIGSYGTNTTYYNNNIWESDARVYTTALSAEDIAELYHSAVIVDNTGKSYAYEYFEAN